MGCQCANQKEEMNDELTKNDNFVNKEEIFGLSNHEEVDQPECRQLNNDNQKEEEYIEKINEDKNVKYSDYPEKMLELINKIREDPLSYSNVIED